MNDNVETIDKTGVLFLDSQNETAFKILESACEVFAEKGYKEASISDICKQAGTNRASINYYFRSKENLFVEVYKYAWGVMGENRNDKEDENHIVSPEERLRNYIGGFIRSIFDEGQTGWFMRIMFHEVVSPNLVFVDVIAKILGDERQYLDGLISEITGETDVSKLHLMNMSVMSNCLFFNMTRNVRKYKKDVNVPALKRPDFRPEEQIDQIIDHVYNFCLSGLKANR